MVCQPDFLAVPRLLVLADFLVLWGCLRHPSESLLPQGQLIQQNYQIFGAAEYFEMPPSPKPDNRLVSFRSSELLLQQLT
jgi:hypothetical protein